MPTNGVSAGPIDRPATDYAPPDAEGPRLLRSSARARHALLHGDVGALQLLRDARVSHPVHGPRAQLRRQARGLRVRHVHGERVGAGDLRRHHRRPMARPVQERADRRHHHRDRPFHARLSRAAVLLRGVGVHRRRHRPAQAQRERHRWLALRHERHATRRRVLDLLHGDQPRRRARAVHRRVSGAARRLARRLRLRRRRHDARTRSIHSRAPAPAAGHRPARASSGARRARRRRPRSFRRRRAEKTFARIHRASSGSASRAMAVFFVFAAIFWGAYEQAGSTLNLFGDRYTRTTILGFNFPVELVRERCRRSSSSCSRRRSRGCGRRSASTRAVDAGEVRDRTLLRRPVVHVPADSRVPAPGDRPAFA